MPLHADRSSILQAMHNAKECALGDAALEGTLIRPG